MGEGGPAGPDEGRVCGGTIRKRAIAAGRPSSVCGQSRRHLPPRGKALCVNKTRRPWGLQPTGGGVLYNIPVPSKSLYKLLDSVKSLCQISDDVVDVLGADRQANRVLLNADVGQLLGGELGMGGGGRVDDQALHISDVRQQREDLQVVDERKGFLLAALDVEGKDGRAAVGEILLIQGVVGVVGQAGMVDLLHLGVVGQERNDLLGVLDVAVQRAKAQSERPAEQRQESPEEYAQTEVQQGISDVAARTGNTAKSTTRISYRKFRAMQEKRKNLTLQGSTQSASKPTEKEKVTVPTQTERREMFKKQRFRQKAIAAKTPAPQAPVPSSATPAPPPCRVQMQQRLKRQHLTREAVRGYLQKQTTATAAGNTAPIVTHAPKLPTISNKQATVEAISRGVHYIAAKIKALLSQTVQHAAQSLLALLGAGGVVLLLAMVIGAAAAVIGSPMGIMFADESGDPNSIRLAEIIAETNADFSTACL